ncbi:Paternally-expressed 3 protein [Dissostichus eleginoides]|uniref:Paternally-expressed 3 protein n=1 Tax=Dissostichus eleginoides TaxID=100907 RepID=A0AAD9B6J0_DISEL|nr:Paternally-expressed 3 protein [Dissostichus eleginoides]
MEGLSISPAFSDPSDHITFSEILDQTLAYLDDLMKYEEVPSPWSHSTMSEDSMGETWCFDSDSDISDMITQFDQNQNLNKVISAVCHSYLFPEDLETEEDDFEETEKPLHYTDSAKTLEVPEPPNTLEVPEPPNTPEVPEPPNTLEVPEPVSTLEVPGPPSTLEVPEPPNKLEVPEPANTLEVPEPANTLEVPEPANTLEVPEPTKTLEVPEPAKTLEVPEPTSPVSSAVSSQR